MVRGGFPPFSPQPEMFGARVPVLQVPAAIMHDHAQALGDVVGADEALQAVRCRQLAVALLSGR